MRPLPLAPIHRWLIVLGDESAPAIDPPAGFRIVRLAMEGASAATVRLAQLPKLKEIGVVPDTVAVFVGAWDLLQSGGEDGLPAAKAAMAEHLDAVFDELRGARLLIGPWRTPPGLTGDEPGLARWETAFAAALAEVAARHGAERWEGL